MQYSSEKRTTLHRIPSLLPPPQPGRRAPLSSRGGERTACLARPEGMRSVCLAGRAPRRGEVRPGLASAATETATETCRPAGSSWDGGLLLRGRRAGNSEVAGATWRLSQQQPWKE